MRILLLSSLLCLLLGSCEPEPFQINLAGYSIQFPTTLGELQSLHPRGHKKYRSIFVDSSQAVKIEWWFDIWSNTGNQDPKNKPHGIVMFLKNKDPQFDSVKTALEQRFKQRLKPLVFTKLNGDFSRVKPIYVCHINKDVFLVLTKSDSFRSEPNSLRIAIGYNLTRKEEETFALLGGKIYSDKL
ncbi:hypothetical protein [Spirosoma sp.]|uniref:hypothetical protein n=1 Tax=Spirosoma sp. TaxID=1899569 RepID=UPI003B3AD296